MRTNKVCFSAKMKKKLLQVRNPFSTKLIDIFLISPLKKTFVVGTH